MKTLWLILFASGMLGATGQFAIEVWKLFRGSGGKAGEVPASVWHNRFNELSEKVDKLISGQARMTVDVREVKQTVQPDGEQKTPPV